MPCVFTRSGETHLVPAGGREGHRHWGQMRGRGGDTDRQLSHLVSSSVQCQLLALNWAHCGRQDMTSERWQPQHVTKTSQRHGTNNFYLHITTLSRKTFRHLKLLSCWKKGVTRDDGNVVVDYLPHHSYSVTQTRNERCRLPRENMKWTLLTFQSQISSRTKYWQYFANRCNLFPILATLFSQNQYLQIRMSILFNLKHFYVVMHFQYISSVFLQNLMMPLSIVCSSCSIQWT